MTKNIKTRGLTVASLLALTLAISAGCNADATGGDAHTASKPTHAANSGARASQTSATETLSSPDHGGSPASRNRALAKHLQDELTPAGCRGWTYDDQFAGALVYAAKCSNKNIEIIAATNKSPAQVFTIATKGLRSAREAGRMVWAYHGDHLIIITDNKKVAHSIPDMMSEDGVLRPSIVK